MADFDQEKQQKVPLGIVFSVSIAFFMENFDGTVLATALPSVAHSLNTTVAAASIGITAYFVSIAIFISLSGWLADRFGTRTIFTAAMCLFALSSLACAFSNSLGSFAVARALQGVAGAMMVPVGRLIILKNAPRSQLVKTMSLVTTPALMGAVLGPPVGGLLSSYADWRFIFLINIPIAFVGIVLIRLYIPQMREERRGFDWLGFIYSGGAVGFLMFGLQSLVDKRFPSDLTFIIFTVGSILFVLAARHARKTSDGLIDLSLLKYETFRSVVIGGGLFFIFIGSVPYLLPLLLQIGLGYSAFLSGMVVFSSALGGLFVKQIAPYMMQKFGFRSVLIFNALGVAVAMAASAFLSGEISVFFVAAILFGFGLLRSLQFSALNTMVYAEVPLERSSRATSLADTLKQLWQGFGVGIAAVVVEVLQSQLPQEKHLSAFEFAIEVMALFAFVAAIVFYKLSSDAGSAVSGHKSS